MILTDAGPLVAIIDRDEADHRRCASTLEQLAGPMLTTWPAFTEAMYLLGKTAGWRGQEPLWRMVKQGDLQLAEPTESMLERIPALMARYQDLPMDLADASLVVVAEESGLDRIFTLDGHFRIYRLPRGKGFTLIP